MNFIIDSPTKKDMPLELGGKSGVANPTEKSELVETDLNDSSDMNIDCKFSEFQTKPTKHLLSLSRINGLHRSSTQPSTDLRPLNRPFFPEHIKKFKTDGMPELAGLGRSSPLRLGPKLEYLPGKGTL